MRKAELRAKVGATMPVVAPRAEPSAIVISMRDRIVLERRILEAKADGLQIGLRIISELVEDEQQREARMVATLAGLGYKGTLK